MDLTARDDYLPTIFPSRRQDDFSITVTDIIIVFTVPMTAKIA